MSVDDATRYCSLIRRRITRIGALLAAASMFAISLGTGLVLTGGPDDPLLTAPSLRYPEAASDADDASGPGTPPWPTFVVAPQRVSSDVEAPAAGDTDDVRDPADCGDQADAEDSAGTIPTSAPNAMRPTVVLVHGAWADASSWNGVTGFLLAEGYDVRAIANPLEDLTTDAEYVAEFLNSVPGPIVLVGHSYGGSVITNAAAGCHKVKALVYVDAAAPDVGETTGSLSGADSVLNRKPKSQLFDTLSYPGAPPGATDLNLQKAIFVQNFAADLPGDVAARLWASQRTASTEAFDTPSEHAAWKTIPSWYFISSGDQIITQTSKMAMAKRANSRVTVFHGGSHLTLISHPDAVTNVIRAAIGSLQRNPRDR
jgi:pimeloyl-ACP methyl ester carboxylesterase